MPDMSTEKQPLFIPESQPFAMPPEQKREYLRDQLAMLLDHHRQRCPGYARIVDDWQRQNIGDEWTVEDYPFVPVTAFKEFELKSTDEPVSAIKSSATTSNTSSQIFADRETKKRQALSANKILADFVGHEKRPYLVFDVEDTVRGDKSFSARGAAIMSLAHLASEFLFVMKQDGDELKIDQEALRTAVEKIGDQPFLAYGFTYILYQAHENLASLSLPGRTAHPNSRFLHSGGWKKLESLAVDKPAFNRQVSSAWGLPPESVIDFYGTVEQVGVPYPDGEDGLKHVPYWAEVLIRKADTLEVAEPGETGLIQLISGIPLAAPNHSVLTEDLGRIVHLDDPDGRRGTAFVFEGRAPRSELRGCSDVARF